MKLLRGNGTEVTVRDVGPVLARVIQRPGGPPIKFNGYRIVDEDEARAVLRKLINAGLYDYRREG